MALAAWRHPSRHSMLASMHAPVMKRSAEPCSPKWELLETLPCASLDWLSERSPKIPLIPVTRLVHRQSGRIEWLTCADMVLIHTASTLL
jgi:hypothetical protein